MDGRQAVLMPGSPGSPLRAAAATQARTAPADTSEDVQAQLKRYGITTVPKPSYEWGGYRYTNPGDAIAAA